ncbi:hypothetical protein NV379_18410 [Paenibacillus sp. N1-5-1-14]|uniref:hypothetical protein n=1 Tax=Paenibacillus radicibacter TaxID=2972488 RepID=UPI00215917E6|nr:hypothetical protein [Paenibacillus radicibacter]MCR8644629.1 hypothetical protein [Paenibacillus radicibacter]
MWMVMGIFGLLVFLAGIGILLHAVFKGTGKTLLYGGVALGGYILFMLCGYQVMQDVNAKPVQVEAAIQEKVPAEQPLEEEKKVETAETAETTTTNTSTTTNTTTGLDPALVAWLAIWQEERAKLVLTPNNLTTEPATSGKGKEVSKQPVKGNPPAKQPATSNVDPTPQPQATKEPSKPVETPKDQGTEQPKGEQSQETKPEPPKDTSSNGSELTKLGGIGDTLSAFIKNYGEKAGTLENATFKSGKLKATFLANNRAISMDYAYSGTLGEAMDFVKDRIPNDAVRVKEKTVSNNLLIQYKSDLLSMVVSHSDFVVVIAKNANDTVQAISMTLGTVSQ